VASLLIAGWEFTVPTFPCEGTRSDCAFEAAPHYALSILFAIVAMASAIIWLCMMIRDAVSDYRESTSR